MRVSVDEMDLHKGFNPGRPRYKVFLDGTEIKNVFTADEEARYVEVAMLDARGAMQLNEARTAVLREERYGDVRIEQIA